MQLSATDQVWNRAVLHSGGSAPRVGDKALSDLLRAHSLIMNGGVHHALEALSPSELESAAEGYTYFKLREAGLFLAGIPSNPTLAEWTGESEDVANDEYERLIPDDDHLEQKFKSAINDKPDDFAPL